MEDNKQIATVNIILVCVKVHRKHAQLKAKLRFGPDVKQEHWPRAWLGIEV